MSTGNCQNYEPPTARLCKSMVHLGDHVRHASHSPSGARFCVPVERYERQVIGCHNVDQLQED